MLCDARRRKLRDLFRNVRSSRRRAGLSRPGTPRFEDRFVNLEIASSHDRSIEPLLCTSAAEGGIDSLHSAKGADHLIEGIDNEAGLPVLYDLGRGAAVEDDYRGATGHRLRHDETKRLVPLDRHEHAGGVPV